MCLEKVKDIFSIFTFIENDEIVIEEKEKNANYKYRFIVNEKCLYLSGGDKNFQQIREIYNKKLLKKVCDGVVILDNEIYFVELKNTLNIKKFTEALQQLISSYIKIGILLNPFCNLKDKKVIFLIAKVYPKSNQLYERQKESYLSAGYKRIWGYFVELSKKRETIFEEIPFENKKLEIDEKFLELFKNLKIRDVILKLEDIEE